MSPQDRTEGCKFTFLSPLCAPLPFSQTAFSFAPDKRPENIPDLEEIISGQQRLHIRIEDAFRHVKNKGLSYMQRDNHNGRLPLSVDGGFSNVGTFKANGAPSEAFRGLSKDHFRLIATNADRSLGSPEGRLSEGPA